jgi:hypothetical protein
MSQDYWHVAIAVLCRHPASSALPLEPIRLRIGSITNRSASCPQPVRIHASPTRDAPSDVTRGDVRAERPSGATWRLDTLDNVSPTVGFADLRHAIEKSTSTLQNSEPGKAWPGSIVPRTGGLAVESSAGMQPACPRLPRLGQGRSAGGSRSEGRTVPCYRSTIGRSPKSWRLRRGRSAGPAPELAPRASGGDLLGDQRTVSNAPFDGLSANGMSYLSRRVTSDRGLHELDARRALSAGQPAMESGSTSRRWKIPTCSLLRFPVRRPRRGAGPRRRNRR